MKFYTNPFVKDAPTVWQVSATEPEFAGYSITREGVTADYYRRVTYSDGSERNELWEQRPSGFMQDKVTGEPYEEHRPKKPGGWGSRVYYPSIIEGSQRFHADKR